MIDFTNTGIDGLYRWRRRLQSNTRRSPSDEQELIEVQAELDRRIDSSRHIREAPPLPDRIIVDQNGHYWRDFGDSLSMCPTTEANEPTEVAASYTLAQPVTGEGLVDRLQEPLSPGANVEAMQLLCLDAASRILELEARVRERETAHEILRAMYNAHEDGDLLDAVSLSFFMRDLAGPTLRGDEPLMSDLSSMRHAYLSAKEEQT